MMPRGANASHLLPLLQLFIIFDRYPSTRVVVIVEDSGWVWARDEKEKISGWGALRTFVTLGKHNTVTMRMGIDDDDFG